MNQCRRLKLLYRAKATRAAPTTRPSGAAVAMAARPAELELAGDLDEEPLLVVEEEVVFVAVEVLVEVLDLVLPVCAADEVKLRLPVGEPVPVPVPTDDRPAGTEAAACWEVTTAGWLVTTDG